jgi:cytochrome c
MRTHHDAMRSNLIPSMRAALLLAGLCGAGAVQAQTAQEGKAAFVVCASCHSVDGSAKPTGPTLKGVVGRKAAADPKYKGYSQALRNSKIVWTAQELDAYLKAPATRVKGTTMMVSVPDEKRRKAIVAYLRSLK